MEMEACMPVSAVRVSRLQNADGDLVVGLGVRLLDEYLEFLAGRCRPNTVLAVAYDLKVCSPWSARRHGGSSRSTCWRS